MEQQYLKKMGDNSPEYISQIKLRSKFDLSKQFIF